MKLVRLTNNFFLNKMKNIKQINKETHTKTHLIAINFGTRINMNYRDMD